MAQPCTHCGLPVWDENPDTKHQFCCYGCEMVHDLNIDDSSFTIPPGLLIRWIIAFVCSMLLLFISITVHIEANTPPSLTYFSAVLATAVFILLGREMTTSLYHEWRKKTVSLASLIFLGTLSSYAISLYHLFGSGQPIYFETSAMILCFYIGSILIDIHLKNRIRRQSTNWQTSVPSVLTRNGNGDTLRKQANKITEEDCIVTEPASIIPVDGVLKSPRGYLNEAFLTGEELPVLKKQGDSIKAGTVAYDESLEIKPTSQFHESSLQSYWDRYRASRAESTHYEQVARKAARMMVLSIIPLSLGVLGWYSWYETLNVALSNSLSVLLISCPCAFAIAIPAALWITESELHRQGIMLRAGSGALERLAQTDHIIFDKTGTLTGEAEVHNFKQLDKTYSSEKIYQLLLALEAREHHPVAKAIRSFTADRVSPIRNMGNIDIIPGVGIQGNWENEHGKVCNCGIFNHLHPAAESTLCEGEYGLFIDNQAVASWQIYYPLKPDARNVINELSENYRVSILSGDPVPKPELESNEWQYFGNMSPEEKSDFVTQCREQSETVFFVGDGLNDLLAMAKSSICMAMYEGANTTKRDADLVQFNPNIAVIPSLLNLSYRARTIFLFNIFWALIYNTGGLLLAILGYLNPLISIAAMIMSSLFVTGNSLRLKNSDISLNQEVATLGASG